MIKILDLSELNIAFVTNFYNAPLSGLHFENGRYFQFEILDYDALTYEVSPLSKCQEIKELIAKTCFEICVGTHWSGNDWADSHLHSDLAGWLRKTRGFFYSRFCQVYEE